MSWQLIFTEQYIHKAAKFIKNRADVENQYAKTLQVLEVNPNYVSLRLHALKGNLDGLHSVSINLKYRIALTIIVTEKKLFWWMWVIIVMFTKAKFTGFDKTH